MGKIVVVVDMQNDFVRTDGALYVPGAEDIVSPIIDLCFGNPTIFTKDTHTQTTSHGTIEDTTLPRHCVKGTEGHDIIDELRPYVDTTIEKETFMLRNPKKWWDYDLDDFSEVAICGVCTDICVVSCALQIRAMYPALPIKVYANCCAGTTPEKHEAALAVMESCLIEVVR